MRKPLNTRQIWGTPILLGLISAAGLVSALVGDGAYDRASWIALTCPVATALYYTLRKA